MRRVIVRKIKSIRARRLLRRFLSTPIVVIAPPPFKAPPLYKFQEVGVRLGHEKYNDRYLLADDMGLGKTAQASVAYHRYHRKKGPLVVVCPAVAKRNWEREIAKFANIAAHVLEKRTPPINGLERLAEGRAFVINYDILGNANRGRTRTWNKFLRRLRPSFVVIDEGHYIKTKTAQRTAHVHQLCKGVKAVAVLTGTPATNRPIELWPIVSLLKPKEFSSFKKFADKFCDPQYSPWGWTYNGATNLDVLHRKLKRTCMIRRRTDEVFKDMPPLTRQVITIEPSNEEMKEYREAERDFLGWLARTAPHRSSNARKAERLTRMQQLKMMCGLIKLPHAHRWINDALEETTGKMIMFGHHKAVVRGSYEKYQKQSVIIDGKVSKAKRQESIDQFTRDRRTRLIFGNIAAAGSAWNGQAATRVGFLEIGWTPGELAQCEKRAHRIGQGEPVFVYYLIIPDTIEDKLLKVIQSKQKVLDEIIDGREQEGSFNLYDELERLMLEKRNNSK